MSEINLKCKNCGAAMQVDKNAKMITCIHCGASHLLSEILDEKDFAFLEKFNAEELENKLLFNDAIKQGETFLFKAEYSKAEEAFKLAIIRDILELLKPRPQTLTNFLLLVTMKNMLSLHLSLLITMIMFMLKMN